MGSSGEGSLLATDEMRVMVQVTAPTIGLMRWQSGMCWNIQVYFNNALRLLFNFNIYAIIQNKTYLNLINRIAWFLKFYIQVDNIPFSFRRR